MSSVNACTFCKRAKRKCNKARPSCANCSRLGKTCVYTEDAVQTHFTVDPWRGQSCLESLKSLILHLPDDSSRIDYSSHDALQRSTVDFVMRIFGSRDNVAAMSADFFTGAHQRVSAVCRHRFHMNLLSLAAEPRADFAALCLCILLIQQKPAGKATNMQPALYFNVKNLVALLETANGLTIDLVHCRVLVTFYEMGHGLSTAAYISIAACARSARALGLHRKRWRNAGGETDQLALEEEKRAWWAVVIMDRFINLCNGDALLVSNDPETTDPLPIEDLLWSEFSSRADIEANLSDPPLLETPFNITVGQMARECQVSHLAGRVIQHVFDPTPDPKFNLDTARQLERTLKAYLPLLANEELRIGKYCGAYGMCNSALFTLYEFMLNSSMENFVDKNQILRSIEEISIGALAFAEASYCDRDENYPPEVLSPYLPYSLCQAGVVQYRLWKQTSHPICKQRLDTLRRILEEFTKRWMVAWQYLEILDNLHGHWPSLLVLAQGTFINTESLGDWTRRE